jgi:SAM-dependent methyltransferase
VSAATTWSTGSSWSIPPLEELGRTAEYDLVTNIISMYESRDLNVVARNISRALWPGGRIVIADFPFPTIEAQIDDHLVPGSTYLELLQTHGFRNVGSFELSPVHAVTHGQW